MINRQFDSLIFDMDGTLWDAVDSYAEVWNKTLRQCDIASTIDRATLLRYMGLTIETITDEILPSLGSKFTEFMTVLEHNEREMMPVLGGKLYPGVMDNIPSLTQRYRLFMVSNCGARGLHNFLHYTGLTPWISDTLTNGEAGRPKAENISLIIERNGLKSPLYIGDTDGDCSAAHAAGIPFMHVTYGFGHTDNADYSASSFSELARMLLNTFK